MPLLRLLGILALAASAGCTRANPDYCDEQQPCSGERVCDLGGLLGRANACVAPLCEPGEVLACRATSADICADNQLETSVEQCEFGCTESVGCLPCPAGGKACRVKDDSYEVAVCADDGSVIDQRECVLGCADDEVCTDIDPSNDLAADLDFIDDNLTAVTDLVLEDGAVINSNGTIVDALGDPVEGFSFRQQTQSDDSVMTVFRVRSLTINGAVMVTGPDLVGFAAIGDIVINGEVQVRAGAIGDPGDDCVGNEGGTLPPDSSGSGGGGFRNDGGDGGSVTNLISGAQGGNSHGSSSLEPLRGGCAGGGELGGAGGGGLQLSTRGRIILDGDAAINAGGQGGDTPMASGGDLPPAGGGGSGGGILLEAPAISVDTTAFIAANGGGGSCVTRTMSVAGADGTLTDQQAQGADCSGNSNSGDGGDGGARAASADNGQATADSGGVEDAGGGGGGSVGRIRVNTVISSPTDLRFSPEPSFSTLDTR